MVHFVYMNFLVFFIIVLINPLVVVVVFGLNFDGQVLISLLNNWNASEEIKSSWNTSDSTPCNNWIGIQCNSNHSMVVSLNLSHHQIYGQLGPQIGNLKYLNDISLVNTSLSGRIPKELGNCRSLETLFLGDNQLEGGIPIELRMLRNLQFLDLHNNNLSGEIPLEITELQGLTNLFLAGNRFTGVVPKALGINSSLVNVNLYNNNFSGEIPPNLCYGKQLEELNLGRNRFHGNIPSNVITTCNTLEILWLSENQLSGSIPPFGANNSLKHLTSNRNYIEGPIPRSMVNCKQLKTLDLGHNRINDTFPIWLKSLPELVLISLQSNRFHGPIVVNSPRKNIADNMLKIIDISYNNFSGELPSEFFSQLIVLMNSSLYNASKDNEIVNHYGAATSVIHKGREIIMYDTIVTKLGLIDFSNNRFQGKIPESIGQLKLLNSLNLSNNNFNGPIPSSLGNMTLLESLDFSKNKLTGVIPLELTKLSFLSSLNLSENQLKGPIPTAGQFLTFGEYSFKGNSKLCGNQLPRNVCDRGYNVPNPPAAPRIPTFKGNSGLCGTQLKRKSCGNGDDHPTSYEAPGIEQSHMDSIFNQGFGWEPVWIGYSCGLALVFITQTIIFGWTYCKSKG